MRKQVRRHLPYTSKHRYQLYLPNESKISRKIFRVNTTYCFIFVILIVVMIFNYSLPKLAIKQEPFRLFWWCHIHLVQALLKRLNLRQQHAQNCGSHLHRARDNYTPPCYLLPQYLNSPETWLNARSNGKFLQKPVEYRAYEKDALNFGPAFTWLRHQYETYHKF